MDAVHESSDRPIRHNQQQQHEMDFQNAIHRLVAHISKSFIFCWYETISSTNHDFVVSCETLIQSALAKFAQLCSDKVDKYKLGIIIADLLHCHILSYNDKERTDSVERQIDEHEYDLCQSSVIRAFSLLSNDNLRKVIFTKYNSIPAHFKRTVATPPKWAQKSTHRRYKSVSSIDNAIGTIHQTTSALYSMTMALVTKAVFMTIIDSISDPKWLYAVIIWLCKKEESESAKRKATDPKKETEVNGCNSAGLSQPISKSREAPWEPTLTQIVVTDSRGNRGLELEEGIDIASSNINFEKPPQYRKPLDNIEIYDTEEVRVNKSCFVLYCITYDGLCYRHPSSGFSLTPPDDQPTPIIDKRATTGSNSVNEPIITQPGTSVISEDFDGMRVYRKRMTVKRRFREFVLLQIRLEENPKIRPYMKTIPKPTKLKAATQNIFSMPGINNIKLDASTIRLRKRFLERFLVSINNCPFIANSFEFREFLSFETAGMSIPRSKSLILQVNLNKVFVGSVKNTLSFIRSNLPGDGPDLNNEQGSDPDAWLEEIQQSTLKLHIQTRTAAKMNLEKLIDSKLSMISDGSIGSFNKSRSMRRHNNQLWSLFRGGSLNAKTRKALSPSNSTDIYPPISSAHKRYSSRSDSNESVYYDASETQDWSQDASKCIQLCDSVPIATRIIDIMAHSIGIMTNPINIVVRFLFGKTIEKLVIKFLEMALTMRSATFCVDGITDSIWGESDEPLDLEGANLDEAVSHLTRLLERSYLPQSMIRSLISSQLESFTRNILQNLESKKRNKYVIYSFLVKLLDELELDTRQTPN